MPRRRRSLNRGTALLAGGSLLLLLGIAAALSMALAGGHDQYGRLALPGETTLKLPAEEVIIFYEEARSVGADDSLDVPGLAWQIRPSNGGPPFALDGDGGVELGGRDGYSFTDIERITVPEAGRYRVSAQPATGSGPRPSLTFGSSEVTTGRVAIAGAGILAGVFSIVLALVGPGAASLRKG